MKFRVNLSTFLLTSIEKSLSPYNKIWISALFGRLLIRTYGQIFQSKGPVIKYLLQGAEDIGRGHQKFDGLVNGPRKIFADFEWAMKCVSE